ncbi:hypothetical protein GGI12_004469, partial [Dipsacomyces acuminosporus]
SLAAHIYSSVGALLDAGFRKIYVANIQPLGVMPFAMENLIAPIAAIIEFAIVKAHEDALAELKKKYGAVANNVNIFDLASAMKTYMNPFVTIPMKVWLPFISCMTTILGKTSVCSDPDIHLFYDSFHPCGRPHYLLGVVFANKIKDPSYEFSIRNYRAAIDKYDIGNSNVTNNIIVNGI